MMATTGIDTPPFSSTTDTAPLHSSTDVGEVVTLPSLLNCPLWKVGRVCSPWDSGFLRYLYHLPWLLISLLSLTSHGNQLGHTPSLCILIWMFWRPLSCLLLLCLTQFSCLGSRAHLMLIRLLSCSHNLIMFSL